LVLLGIRQIEDFYWDNENIEPVSLIKKIQESNSASAPVTDSKGNNKLWNHLNQSQERGEGPPNGCFCAPWPQPWGIRGKGLGWGNV